MAVYNKRIGENFDRMQTKPEEWVQADITQYKVVNDKVVPYFYLPTNYTKPDTLYPCIDPFDVHCELCNHPIINIFYLLHHEKKYILMVGSECINNYVLAKMPKEKAQVEREKLKLKIKPEEVEVVNKYLSQGKDALEPVKLTKLYISCTKYWNKRYIEPDEKVEVFWKKLKKEYQDAVNKLNKGIFLEKDIYSLARYGSKAYSINWINGDYRMSDWLILSKENMNKTAKQIYDEQKEIYIRMKFEKEFKIAS